MAKRSPILGYNHNVRYRGLVFHVQTEDSGVLSPHLFTHLFHGGVIVSTRKLVYDAGASPEAIKALMQAQHKAVLKDLNKGAFDIKIDQYLGGTPGLEPRNPALGPPAAAPNEPQTEQAVPEAILEGNDTEVRRRRVARDTLDDPMLATRLESGSTSSSTPPLQDKAAQSTASGVIELTKVRVAAPSQPPPAQTSGTLPRIQNPPQAVAAAGSVEIRAVAPPRSRNDSDPAQIYSPPPPAVEPPPGRVHVTGQYGAKRPLGKAATGLDEARSSAQAHGASDLSTTTVRGIEPLSKTATRPASPVAPPPAGPPLAVPRTATLPSRSPMAKPFAGQPSRGPVASPPAAAAKSGPVSHPPRSGSPAGTPAPASSVVMTRPAVIVGAPNATSRKAPDPPSGPVQGLISEKSLDEVIHAYLSEDGEDG